MCVTYETRFVYDKSVLPTLSTQVGGEGVILVKVDRKGVKEDFQGGGNGWGMARMGLDCQKLVIRV